MNLNWPQLLKVGLIVLVVAILAGLGAKPIKQAINLGLDLRGGVHIVYQAKGTKEAPVNDDAMTRTVATLDRRVNAFGVSEPLIQREGKDRIIVELAGLKDPDAAVKVLGKTALLEFKDEKGKVVVTGRDIKDAKESINPATSQPYVSLSFNSEGTRKFAEATAANVNKNIAIILDGKIVQNPLVKEPITKGQAEISPYGSIEEAREVALLLRSGALPVTLEIMEKRTVGPTLGSDSLNKSVKASIIGIMAIMLFMLGYYRLPGLIANFSLVIYGLIVMGIMALINATLTLPGIAGFILSIGMAVDANVIIYERVKDELRNGKTLLAAIDSGFKRAFVAIFDSNVTTLIAAAVLYYFGTGAIRGFAVTLSLGILASMFTAITFTRFILKTVAQSNLATNRKLYGA